MIERFFRWAGLFETAGTWIPWSEFLQLFADYMQHLGKDPGTWTEEKFRRELGPGMPIGRGPRNVKSVGNVSREFRVPRRFVADRHGNIRLEEPHVRIAS